jgi:multisubunit Na+/H+ antiporter MnhC subunit
MNILLDPKGKISTIRICCIIVTISIMSIFIAHNIIAMIRGMNFVSIGLNETILLSGVLGAKAVQSFSENKQDKEEK